MPIAYNLLCIAHLNLTCCPGTLRQMMCALWAGVERHRTAFVSFMNLTGFHSHSHSLLRNTFLLVVVLLACCVSLSLPQKLCPHVLVGRLTVSIISFCVPLFLRSYRCRFVLIHHCLPHLDPPGLHCQPL